MDVSEFLLPGVQNLLSAMLDETWSAVRGLLARKLGRGKDQEAEQISSELENARATALRAVDSATARDRREAEVFLAGYLYGLQQRYPDLGEAAASAAMEVHVSGHGNTVSSGEGITLVVHRDVGSAVTISDMSGDINITGRP